MRKNILIFIALMPYPAFAQISSGTIIIFNLTKDEIVVAADSRALTDNGGPPDDSYCKIAAIRDQFIFTSVGSARYAKTNPADTVESWDNAAVARDALRDVTEETVVDDAFMDRIATYWGTTVKNNWNSLCLLHREKCAKSTTLTVGNPQLTELTAGIFIGAKGLFVRGVSIDFDSDMARVFNPVDYAIGTLGQCWPCGEGEQICAAGSHVDVAAQFCSERKADTKLSVRTALTGADKHAKLAVEIVEKTIDAYEQSAGDVGGPVDSVTITKGGGITWNSRKDNCP